MRVRLSHILTPCAGSACRGFMKKKSPKGIKGFHAWQMRWFELTTLKLCEQARGTRAHASTQ